MVVGIVWITSMGIMTLTFEPASKCIVSYVKLHKIDLILMSKSSKMNSEKIDHESTVNYVYGHVKCPMFNI